MNRDDYAQVKKIFQSAIDIAPDERAAFLDEACAGNEDLRREVERLLDSVDSQYLETPAVAGFADVIVEEKSEEPTIILPDDENEPTRILQDEPQDAEPRESPDENVLRPSRLRIALVCLLFVFAVGAEIIQIAQDFSMDVSFPIEVKLENERLIVSLVEPEAADVFKVGDEVASINNIPVSKRNLGIVLHSGKPGDQYTFQLKRGGEAEPRDVTLTAEPYPFPLTNNIIGIIVALVFLVTGLAVFLLKPNDKQALIMAVFFIIASLAIQCESALRILELPVFFTFWWRAGYLAPEFFHPLLVHLFLVFPGRSRILHRFPKLEWLIYIPVLFYGTPINILIQLSNEGFRQFDFAASPILSIIDLPIVALFLLGTLAILIFNYRKADAAIKRRIRLIVAGFIVALTPFALNIIVISPICLLFNIDPASRFANAASLIILAPWILMPLTFAYAIVRHKVIPVSFVVRRGLQYLLAKNALRLLLVLPVLGIIWNIAARPDRTLSEIFAQNSFSFYLFIVLAGGLVLVNRLGLREWIDRKFFREQYQQEKVLRELTETVAESDSLTILSRLVSSKIQAALHPENVYLFFRDDAHQSSFSLGYSTSTGRGTSDDLKLAADSPLLRFMQEQQRKAIDFPIGGDGDLPHRESAWLRSIGASLLVPMLGSDRKLAGFFSLGEKKSEIPYTGRDKELLETLAQQIALVHENLNLKDRVRREQKIKTEVLSRFDEGNINLLKECPECGKCFDRIDEQCDEDGSELAFSLPVERTIENRYELEKLLGKGGMGAVYEATDLRINRRVALKILGGGMFGNRDALRRFEREAQTAGRLHHHNIVTVFDYGVLSTEGAFLVMEFIRGESLAAVLKREDKLDPAIVSNWFTQILDGVGAAHKAGIVHRDMKPENVVVSLNESGQARPCILDFGLARLSEDEIASAGNVTVPGTVIGTFGYMPPEQLRGEKVDERTDLFAVAVMIYEALHGVIPFRGKSYHELLTAMAEGIGIDPDMKIPDFFERGLANDPEKRFASAIEMRDSLINSLSPL